MTDRIPPEPSSATVLAKPGSRWVEIGMGEYQRLLKDPTSYATVRCTLGPDLDIWERLEGPAV